VTWKDSLCSNAMDIGSRDRTPVNSTTPQELAIDIHSSPFRLSSFPPARSSGWRDSPNGSEANTALRLRM